MKITTIIGARPQFIKTAMISRILRARQWVREILEKNARLIVTDSGGIQKEAYFHEVPCVTLRDETEWVDLVEAGANILVGADKGKIIQGISRMMEKEIDSSSAVYGRCDAAEKVVEILDGWCNGHIFSIQGHLENEKR